MKLDQQFYGQCFLESTKVWDKLDWTLASIVTDSNQNVVEGDGVEFRRLWGYLENKLKIQSIGYDCK